MAFRVPEKYRLRTGRLASSERSGKNGVFFIPQRKGPPLKVIATDGAGPGRGWEHVSVSLSDRCPTWDEMNRVKALFWEDEDTVMQLHVPRSQWISNHAYCLHMWRPQHEAIPMPPSEFVGVPGITLPIPAPQKAH